MQTASLFSQHVYFRLCSHKGNVLTGPCDPSVLPNVPEGRQHTLNRGAGRGGGHLMNLQPVKREDDCVNV